MPEIANQSWPYIATVLVTALVLGRRVKLWGPGFGVEVNHSTENSKSKAPPKRKRKRRTK